MKMDEQWSLDVKIEVDAVREEGDVFINRLHLLALEDIFDYISNNFDSMWLTGWQVLRKLASAKEVSVGNRPEGTYNGQRSKRA